MSDPVQTPSTNWTPATPVSSNWTPGTIGSSNWNSSDAFESAGNLLLMDNASQLLAEDNSTFIVLQ